jgi:hypothetical protein
MKEYIAETGGRYTYSDDILNLQELALSMSAVFDSCSDFIISGCEPDGPRISPGYVWLGGKVRRFEGAADAVYPYYIYEANRHESVVYANDVNKRGRTCYLCAGAKAIPETTDPVTGKLPVSIEVTESYAPRFIDKFFGRYAVLLDTPFTRQTVKKDLVLAGTLTGQKEINSRTAVSVSGENGYMLKGVVKTDGGISLGAYLHGLPVNEIIIRTDGGFSFMKQGKELVRITEDGISYGTSLGDSARIGAIRIKGSDIYNTSDTTDEGCVRINYYGAQGGGTRYRNFAVHDGKSGSSPVLEVTGRTATVRAGCSSCRMPDVGSTFRIPPIRKTMPGSPIWSPGGTVPPPYSQWQVLTPRTITALSCGTHWGILCLPLPARWMCSARLRSTGNPYRTPM